jgi:hypothetical protein
MITPNVGKLDLESRAMAAYFRAGNNVQPSISDSGVEEHSGKTYVVLRNSLGVLKVYRVRPDGVLKGLKRYPKAIDEI